MTKNNTAILIPCFNEEFRLKCEEIKTFIDEKVDVFDFYFVNDGSTDNTSEIIRTNIIINTGNAFLINLPRNLGKGNAIRSAFFQIEKEYRNYGFIDADLQIPLRQLDKLQNALDQTGTLMAITSRDIFKSIKKFKLRSLISISMVIVANWILKFHPRIKDSQCGCKMFKAETINACFENEFISGWLFDLEILLRFRERYSDARNKLVEVPVSLVEASKNSKVIFTQNLMLVSELIKINARYN